MLNEETTIFNRDKIIETARKLFYESGYSQTSFRNIAEACEITKGLITYHFDSKANLAKEVIYIYNLEIKNAVEEKILLLHEDYNALINMVVEALVLNEMYQQDKYALRFFLDYLDSGFGNQYIDGFAGFYKMIDRQYQFKKSDTEYKMLCTSQMFTALSLVYSFFSGNLDCTFEEYVEFSLKLQLKILGLSENEQCSVYSHGSELREKIDYSIQPYFKVI